MHPSSRGRERERGGSIERERWKIQITKEAKQITKERKLNIYQMKSLC
jgi:hypothetical protein